MTNGTLPGWGALPWYLVYVGEGSVTASTNLIITLAIIKYQALSTTKEYVIIFGLSLADTLNQLGYVAAGSYRSWLVLSGQHADKKTSWGCMLLPHNMLWSFSGHLATLMLSVISFDRLFLVCMPYKYLPLTYRYSVGVLLVAYGSMLSLAAIGYALTYSTRNDAPSIAARCITPQALAKEHVGVLYSLYYNLGDSVFAVLSVVLYAVVLLIRKHKMGQVHVEQRSQAQLDRQRRLTKTLAISSACSFFLYVVPRTLANVAATYKWGAWPLVFNLTCNLNPLCNAFLYPLRHREMMKAIKGLFACKSMPQSLSMWVTHSRRTTSQGATKNKRSAVGTAAQSAIEMQQPPEVK